MNEIRTLFMGSPEFAVPSLRAIVEDGYNVIGVVTQPDKPVGRSQKLTPPPLKRAAEELNITVYQPSTLRDEAFASLLDTLKPELIIVAAYGKLLPKNVLDYPHLGCINVHASLLPLYRGADPIRRAIIDGREFTGVTIMRMNEGCDTGDILSSVPCSISSDDTCGTLTAKLAEVGATTLITTLRQLDRGSIHGTPQNDAEASYAPKLSDNELQLDFSQSAVECERLIRAADPSPVAETILRGNVLKIVSAIAVDEAHVPAPFPDDAPCGYVTANRKEVFVKCGEGMLKLISVIPAGRRRMDASSLLNGRQIARGDRLGVCDEAAEADAIQ